jgi:biotin transport system substrate-specific component
MAFIPGDVIKAFVAALLGRAVMVGYPLLPSRA